MMEGRGLTEGGNEVAGRWVRGNDCWKVDRGLMEGGYIGG